MERVLAKQSFEDKPGKMIIDPRDRPPNDDPDTPAFATLRKVHRGMGRMLSAQFGEEIPARHAADPNRVLEPYTFSVFGFYLEISLALHSDTAALLTADIFVGRLYRGYGRALRWLANNRAGRSVSIAFGDQHAKRSELWLSCARVTTSGNRAGLRAALKDIHDELAMVDAGLRMWFPQTLRGDGLTDLEKLAEDEEVVRLMLTSPQGFLDHAHQHSDEQISAALIRDVYGWLGQWDEQLRHLDRFGLDMAGDRKSFLWWRARALFELRRYEELIRVCQELESLADEREKPTIIGVVAQAFYERGEFEEALDVARSATHESSWRVWFTRCLAQARLGRGTEAMESYSGYERLVGKDIIAAKIVREVMAESQGTAFDQSASFGSLMERQPASRNGPHLS